MDASGYADLYALQDEVMAVVFDEPAGFYLTGGTALSRYYLGHRYSDDLLFIARKRHFSWSSVLTEVADKETFQLEDLLYRLSTFPVALLSTVPFVQEESISLHSAILGTLREDIAVLGENTVAEPGSCNL